MSAFDVIIRNNITCPLLIVIFLSIVIYLWKTVLPKYRKRMFVPTLLNFALIYEKPAEKVKLKLFSYLHDMLSSDKKLRNEGRIRILEIGIGTGTNFRYYPKSCQLIPLDPNGEVETKLIENCKNYPHIELKNLIVAEAENMEQIEDNSIDAVVSSCVLCSAKDPNSVLREIKRVLHPGAKFFFLEHIHAEKGTLKNILQSALTVTYIWPASALGCQLNRHTGETILKAGFTKVDIKETDIVIEKPYVLKVMNPHIYGIATKKRKNIQKPTIKRSVPNSKAQQKVDGRKEDGVIRAPRVTAVSVPRRISIIQTRAQKGSGSVRVGQHIRHCSCCEGSPRVNKLSISKTGKIEEDKKELTSLE